MAATLALTFDNATARVNLAGSGFVDATVVLVERSTDLVRWTTVRGGVAVPVTAGAWSLDDYEFPGNRLTYYRATPDVLQLVHDSATRTVASGLGSADTGQAYTIQGTATDYAATGSVLTITPTAANADRSGRLTAGASNKLRTRAKINLSALPSSNNFQLGLILRGTDVNNWYVGKLQVATGTGAVTLITHKRVGGTQTDMATVASGTLTVATDYMVQVELSGQTTNGGNTLSLKWWPAAGVEPAAYQLVTNDLTGQPADSGNQGGVFARTAAAAFTPVVSFDELFVWDLAPAPVVSSITPALTSVWLKSTTHPFLNQAVQLGGPPLATTRAGRGGTSDVVNRPLPIGATDQAGSRQYQLRVRTTSLDQAQTLEYLLASGDFTYLHGPDGAGIPKGGVYLWARSSTQAQLRINGAIGRTTIDVQEVAAPGPDIVYAKSTWDSVLAAYATWSAVLAAFATWADLLALVGDPAQVLIDT